MEEIAKAMMEMLRIQHAQTSELLNQNAIRQRESEERQRQSEEKQRESEEKQRESEERQIQILKFFEEKQTKMEAELKKTARN
jgi:hypothetical protein